MLSRSSAVRPYAAAVFTVALVTGVKLASGPALGRDLPFALFGLSVVAAGWMGGPRGALVATVLATLTGWFYFLAPYASFILLDWRSTLRVAALGAEGCLVTLIVARMEGARRAAEASAESLGRLQSMTAALAGARTPEEIAELMVQHGRTMLRADTGLFFQPRVDGRLELVAQQGLESAALAALNPLAGDAPHPAAAAFREGAAQWLEGGPRSAHRASTPADANDRADGAVAALPLLRGGKPLATLAFGFEGTRLFSPVERTLVETLAAQAAQAFERARLFAAEVRARQRLEMLGELTDALSSVLTENEVANVVVDRGRRAADADICTLYVRDSGDDALLLIGAAGVVPAVLDRIRRISRDSANPVFSSLTTGHGIWAENEQQYAAIYPALAGLKSEGRRARAFWSVPLVSEGQSIGVLGMGFYEPRVFAAEERAFVATFARHCAEALRRAQLVEAERAATAAARQMQSSLETTLRSIGDAVIATDERGAVTFMNPVAEKLTGWPEHEARGVDLREVFRIKNEHTGHEVENPVAKVLRDGVVVGLANHTVLLHRDGALETPIDDSGAPIRGASGAISGVVLVFRDVSTHKREEARRSFLAEATSALSESLDYEVTLARVAQMAVPRLADWCAVDLDDGGRGEPRRLAVAHVDPRKVELAHELGRKYPPQKGRGGVMSVLKTGRSELYTEIPDELLQQSAIDEEHLRVTRELGLRSAMIVALVARERVLGAMSFIHAESGRHYTEDDLHFAEDLARRCAVALDNAQLYASEQRARKVADVANSSKDEFLATVSHELRTPLNAIMGWAKMLSTRTLDAEKSARAIATIDRNAVAMARLIEDLLDVARITSGKMRLEVDVVDIAQVVEAAIEATRPAADAKDVRLSALVEREAGPVSGDAARLQQVIWNLLSNAVKFTPKGGRVEVVARGVDSSVEIAVSDTGAGIDPAFLPFVFDAFRQDKATQRASRGGLGLGLAITRQLVELHGGRVEARSDGDGHGATFTVWLPIRALSSGLAADPAPSGVLPPSDTFERPTQLQGLRVLVVDDDEDCRQLVKTVLEHCGSSVAAVSGVDEALAALTAELPDVILSDIGMPGRDGYDLIRELRALPASRGGHLPAGALTANAYADARRRVLNAGFTMHIAKPVEPAELIAVVVSLSRYSPRRGQC